MRKLALCTASLLLLSSSALLAQRPPSDLHLEGDHWTAWYPPAPPAGSEVHTVQPGDTLWDLAQRFYGNPYLWPQLWERNRYVEDAHWIYPGDPLVVSVQVTPIEDVVASTDAADMEMDGAMGDGDGDAGDDGDGLRLDRSARPPVPLGYESDIYCSGFVGGLDEAFESSIIGSEYEALMPSLAPTSRLAAQGTFGAIETIKFDMSVGDIIYVDGGLADGVVPGSVYWAIKPQEQVKHPVKGNVLGRFYRFSGRVRVLSVQEDSAIAEIVQNCMPINVGDVLRPFTPDPVPLARRGVQVGVNDPVSAGVLDGAPMIIRSEAGVFSIGQDHVVYVDRGAEDVTPGDIFTIYRLNKRGLPPVVVGELGILAAHEHSAVAKVIESRHTVYVGDLLAIKQ